MAALIIMLILLGVIYHVISSVSGGSSNNAPTPATRVPEPRKYDEEFLKLCSTGTAEAVRAALASGKNPNETDNNGMTALMYAARDNGDEEVLRILINAGADVKAKNRDGNTALHFAPVKPINLKLNPKIIDVLVVAGSIVDARSNIGITPLMVAAMSPYDNSINIKALIKAGTDVEATYENAIPGGTVSTINSVLTSAISSDNAGNLKAIIEAGADVNRQIKGKAWQRGRYIDAVDIYDYPLSMAVSSHRVEIVRLLLDAGAYINVRDSWGDTPLLKAQKRGKIEAAKLLESRGATL